MLVIKAIRFGGPEVLVAEDVADPVPGEGQVVVDVAAVDVLFVEAQVRTGWGQEYFAVKPPYVPGDGIAGVVSAAAGDVTERWLGRRVVGWTGSANAYAERATVGADRLVEIPDEVSFTDAAALSHDGPMALTLVETAAVRPGERVLVLGANGGAGLLTVRLAAAAGAHVIGAARGEAKQRLVRDAGAAAVVDPGQLAPLRRSADVVFDGVGGELGTAAFETVRDGGRFFRYGAPTGGFATVDEETARHRGITLYGLAELGRARTEITSLMSRVLEDTTLRPVIGATFRLSEAAAAHAAMEARKVPGKVLLTR